MGQGRQREGEGEEERGRDRRVGTGERSGTEREGDMAGGGRK